MKCVYRVGLSCWCVLAFQGVVSAQQSTTSPSATLVAVVDIATVFDSHPQFKAGRDAMQRDLTSLESGFAAKQESIATKGEALKNYSPTSMEYKRLESDLTRQAADLQVQVRQAKKDFLLREAQDYYRSFTEVLAAVESVAEKYQISLVLRFDSRPIDPTNPQSVAQGVSRPVVLQRDLDITRLVIEELPKVLAAKAAAGTSPVGARTARTPSQIPRR